MAINRSKGTITLTWSMDDDSWSHWARGRGRKTEQAVILAGLSQIRKSLEARKKIKSWCKNIGEYHDPSRHNKREDNQHRNTIEIQLPAADWGEACHLIGTPDNPVSTIQLLAAVILESETWKQRGIADAEYASGWSQDQLISSIAGSAVARTTGFSLGKQERFIAWIVAIATIATAGAAWLDLYRDRGTKPSSQIQCSLIEPSSADQEAVGGPLEDPSNSCCPGVPGASPDGDGKADEVLR